MELTSLSVQNVRRIAAASIVPSTEINLISGSNGSGKTSLLESIHYLATARSFRTSRALDVISHGQLALVVSGELKDATGQSCRVGVEKAKSTTRLKFNSEAVTIASKIARLVPVLTFNTESYLLLDGGPANRRALLDRLLFHVEHEYLDVLKIYYKGLKQRNALLRSRADRELVRSWDHQLAPEVAKIDRWRTDLVETINKYLAKSELVKAVGPLRLEYGRGWHSDQEYIALLEANWLRDRDSGVTGLGPHRAELRIKIDNKLAKTVVSRGQGKLIIAAIICAQSKYLRDYGREAPILLIDDLAAELDRSARQLAAENLLSTKAQTFFTAIEASDLPDSVSDSARMFHVEQGRVSELATAG